MKTLKSKAFGYITKVLFSTAIISTVLVDSTIDVEAKSTKKKSSSKRSGSSKSSAKKSSSKRSASSRTSTKSSKRSASSAKNTSTGNSRRASATAKNAARASAKNVSGQTTTTTTDTKKSSGIACPVGKVLRFDSENETYYYAKKKTCSIPENAHEESWDSSSSLKKLSWIDASEAVFFECDDEYVLKNKECISAYDICPINEGLEKNGKKYINPNTDEECSLPANSTAKKLTAEEAEDFGLDSGYIANCKENYYASGLKNMPEYIAQCIECPEGTEAPAGSKSASACVKKETEEEEETTTTTTTQTTTTTLSPDSTVQESVSTTTTTSTPTTTTTTSTSTPTTTTTATTTSTPTITSCSAGQKLVNGSCETCPANTYSAGGTSTTCTSCPSGTEAPTGSSSLSACVEKAPDTCGIGQYKSGSSCVACSSAKYSGYTVSGTKPMTVNECISSGKGNILTCIPKIIKKDSSIMKTVTNSNPSCGSATRTVTTYCQTAGSTSSTANSKTTSETKNVGDCKAGYTCQIGSCDACSAGTYKSSSGNGSCTACTNKPSNSSYSNSSGLTSNSCPWTCDSGYTKSSSKCCPSTAYAYYYISGRYYYVTSVNFGGKINGASSYYALNKTSSSKYGFYLTDKKTTGGSTSLPGTQISVSPSCSMSSGYTNCSVYYNNC